jgi:NAD(P)H-dependent flavin oxidoreductase YrpB (nitropropane dioxygenase family)
MATLKEPWIAFKVLAAGAITPEVGLKYAFTNGADFVCMGMYDFQIVEDVNIALNTLSQVNERQRPWMA